MKERQLTVLVAVPGQQDRAALRETLFRGPLARSIIVEAEDGASAIKLFRAHQPDCLILDRNLPDLDALDVLKKLAGEEESPACGIVMLIDESDARLAVEAMKIGAHDCLERKRASRELLHAVSHAIEEAERHRLGAERERVMAGAEIRVAKAAATDSAAGSRQERAYHNRADEQLRLLKTAIEQSNESVVITTSQLDWPGPQIIYVNPAFTRMTGYSLEDVIGKTPRILQGPKTDRAVLDRLRKDCEEGRTFRGETVNYRKDGSEFYLEWSIEPVRDERGEVTHFVATQRDVTERRRIEADLRRSEEEFRSLFELSAIGMTQVSPEGRYLRVNRKLCQILGYSEQELLRLTLHDVTHPDDRERSAHKLGTSFADGTDEFSIEKRYVRKNGSIIWVQINWTVLRGVEGQPLHTVASIQDITARKQAEQALRESESHLRQLADAMPQIVFTCGADGLADYANQQLREYFGVSDVREIAKTWMETIHPDDRERANQRWMEAVSSDQPFEFEFRLRRKDGQYRWHLCRAIPIRDQEGRVIKWIGTSTDIHDRKQAEAEREELLARAQAAQRQAEEANRSKDEFLAVISHELRSPLNAMLGYAALLRRGGLKAHETEHAAEVIERSGKTQAQLIDDLLDTARIISGKLRLDIGPVNLVSVIEEAVQTIYPAVNAKGISLQIELRPEVGQITGDHKRLQQVVWNLLSNAVKFTPEGGRVDVRLERIDPHICISVSDTGKGIQPDFLPYIFDRFRQADATSARRYGGLGLGLALVKYLVELHGGTIEVASEGEGLGTTFKLLLPVRAIASPVHEAEGAPIMGVGPEIRVILKGLRVLVVDDEDDARELVKVVLTQAGAEVAAASSAAEAFAMMTTFPPQERPDVMIIDIGMPREDGYSLMRRLREWERNLGMRIPAVALTAYGQVEDRVRALNAGFQMHVTKPVEPAELAVVVASLVKRADSGLKI